jgi:hypothetical protein
MHSGIFVKLKKPMAWCLKHNICFVLTNAGFVLLKNVARYDRQHNNFIVGKLIKF